MNFVFRIARSKKFSTWTDFKRTSKISLLAFHVFPCRPLVQNLTVPPLHQVKTVSLAVVVKRSATPNSAHAS